MITQAQYDTHDCKQNSEDSCSTCLEWAEQDKKMGEAHDLLEDFSPEVEEDRTQENYPEGYPLQNDNDRRML